MEGTVTIRKIVNANNHIRYVDAFTVSDGAKIKFGDNTGTVKYCDGYHVDINNNVYHIDQFAEILYRNGVSVAPVDKDDVIMKYFLINIRNEKDFNDTKTYYGRGWRIPYKEEVKDYLGLMNIDTSEFYVSDVYETSQTIFKKNFENQPIFM